MPINNKYIAVIISGIFFTLIHVFQSYTSVTVESIMYFITILTVGISCGVSLLYTDSIINSILNHFIWNGLTVGVMVIKIIIG